MKLDKVSFTISLIFVSVTCFTQGIGVGKWSTHFSYSNIRRLVSTEDRIYASSQYGLFYIDLEDHSIQIVSPINGLSDYEVSHLKYHEKRQELMIGYANGNIDLVLDGSLTNIPDIRNSDAIAVKSVLNSFLYEDHYYVLTESGIGVIDSENMMVKEFWDRLGPEATPTTMVSGAVFRDTLFVKLRNGLIHAPLNANLNLLDFNVWVRDTLAPDFQGFVNFSDRLFGWETQKLYQNKEKIWVLIDSFPAPIQHVDHITSELSIVFSDSILLWDGGLNFRNIQFESDSALNRVVFEDNSFWLADQYKGLIHVMDKQEVAIKPSGPIRDGIIKLKYANNKIYAFQRSKDELGGVLSNGGFLMSQDRNGWANDVFSLDNVSSFTHSTSLNRSYLSSFGDGLFVLEGKNVVNHIFQGEQITDVITDSQGRVWVLFYDTPNSLKYLENGEWRVKRFADSLLYADELISDELGGIWIRLEASKKDGAVAFTPSTDKEGYLNTNTSDLINDAINDIVLDSDLQVWFATDFGVSVLPYTSEIFRESGLDTYQPIYDGFVLFDEQPVTSMEIDPGDRKWMGTAEGLWLIDDNTNTQYHFFNTENSPLPSNNILDLKLNRATGELFIATDRGLVSFRSNSTRTKITHDMVQVFPNPVPPEFNGEVGITGLVNGAEVKITDINGGLVKNIPSFGGGASWDLRNTSGHRVASGVYLVFSADQLGTETYVGKIAVVR